MLFMHLNEVALSTMKKKVEASESIKKRKDNLGSITENYGVSLLKEDQVHDRIESDSDEEDQVNNRVNMMLKIKDLITPKPAQKLPKLSVKWK